MAESIAAMFDALYSRFVLRDVVGKIVPGAILISAVGARLGIDAIGSLASSGAVAAIAFCGVAWITSFCAQHLGEKTGWLRYWPSKYTSRDKRYDLRIQFMRLASVDEKQQAERLVVIKEATGLASVGCLVASASWIAALFEIGGDSPANRQADAYFFVVLFVLVAAAWLLRASHISHCERQYAFMDRVVPREVPTVSGKAEPDEPSAVAR